MPHSHIRKTKAITAHDAIADEWKKTHPGQTEPSVLIGKRSTYKFLFFLTEPQITIDPGLTEQDFAEKTYLIEKTSSPLHHMAREINTQILNYLRARRKKFFLRDPNDSYPRALFGIYFARFFKQAAAEAIDQQLVDRFETEHTFTQNIIKIAFDNFPTSYTHNTRTTFHHLLRYILDSLLVQKQMAIFILERQSLKEKIETLKTTCLNFTFEFLDKLPYLFSNLKFENTFLLKDLDNVQFVPLRSSVVGRWLTELKMVKERLMDQDSKINAAFSIQRNRFLEETETLLQQLIAEENSPIAEEFKKSRDLLLLYIKLYGYLLEIMSLTHLLSDLAAIAGDIGDYNVVFIPSLCIALKNSLHCTHNLFNNFIECFSAVLTTGFNSLPPANKNNTNINLRVLLGYNKQINENYIGPIENMVNQIRKVIERIEQKGMENVKKKSLQVQTYARDFVLRQLKLQTINRAGVELCDMSDSKPVSLDESSAAHDEILPKLPNLEHCFSATVTNNLIAACDTFETALKQQFTSIKKTNSEKDALAEFYKGQNISRTLEVIFGIAGKSIFRNLAPLPGWPDSVPYYSSEKEKKVYLSLRILNLISICIYLRNTTLAISNFNAHLYTGLELKLDLSRIGTYKQKVDDYIEYRKTLALIETSKTTDVCTLANACGGQKGILQYLETLKSDYAKELQPLLPDIYKILFCDQVSVVINEAREIVGVCKNSIINDVFKSVMQSYTVLMSKIESFPPLPNGNRNIAIERLNSLLPKPPEKNTLTLQTQTQKSLVQIQTQLSLPDFLKGLLSYAILLARDPDFKAVLKAQGIIKILYDIVLNKKEVPQVLFESGITPLAPNTELTLLSHRNRYGDFFGLESHTKKLLKEAAEKSQPKLLLKT